MKFKDFYIIESTLMDIVNKWRKEGIRLKVKETKKKIYLQDIIVPEKSRGSGTGSKVIQDLVDYADSQNKLMTTTPDDVWGGDKKRLIPFYKKFGFIENKGKDEIEEPEEMYRLPNVNNEDLIDEKFTYDQVKKLYDEYNKNLFDNKLPNIPIKFNRSKRVGAFVNVKYLRTGGNINILFNTLDMTISNFFKKNEEHLKKILLHEMIHVYFIAVLKDIKESHGVKFERMRKELSEKSGINIPRTENISEFEIDDDIKSKDLDVILYENKDNPDQYGIMVFKKNVVFDNLNYFIPKLKIALRYFEIYLIKTNHRKLLAYPIKVKPKIQYGTGFYKIDKDLANDVINTAKELKRVEDYENLY